MSATSSMPRLQQYFRKLERRSRHVSKIINYGTPKKLANILLAEWELRRQKTTLLCRPYYYIIDVCNVCNLRCPLCPTGNTTIARKQAMLSLAQYKELFDKVKEYALVVSLYNHGEPLLNPDVFSIIEHTHRNRVGTNISSNFNWPQPVEINDFIRSGLDYVTVSLDGITQEFIPAVPGARRRRRSLRQSQAAPFGEEGSEVQNAFRRVAVHRLQAQRAPG